jgi:hypothetical protein
MRIVSAKARPCSASVPLYLGGVWQTPVSTHGLSRPSRARLHGGGVVKGEYEIELGSIRRRELVPRLGPQLGHVVIALAQNLQCQGMDISAWAASGAEGPELAMAKPVQNAFGHDRARRIPRAKKLRR